jgi:SSS family solute:Na+ symporter
LSSLNSSGFGVIDGLIIFVYLGTLMAIGIYFSRQQKTLDDFFKSGKQLG